MVDSIARFLRWALALCTPHPRGRHRAGATLLRQLPAVPPHFTEIREQHRQRARRRALYLATLGIDVGPDCIHGVRVATR
ncbi:hypothetical protein AB0B50_43120 [Streptomyces sp. NPDC041068]|uniref:hypothetical protein n=1 Tax=Streptomyces sp. NPDC041068 TaxID=3155130 RepID=UPI00340C6EA7